MDIHEQPHRNLLELAKLNGKATGNVSTAELQDATPAALLAHVTASQVLRSRGHQQAVPEQCPGERRRRLDHRAVAEDPP